MACQRAFKTSRVWLLFVPIMAVANESIDSWVSEQETCIDLIGVLPPTQSVYHKIKREVHPFHLLYLTSTMGNNNLTSHALRRCDHLLFLLCFTATRVPTQVSPSRLTAKLEPFTNYGSATSRSRSRLCYHWVATRAIDGLEKEIVGLLELSTLWTCVIRIRCNSPSYISLRAHLQMS